MSTIHSADTFLFLNQQTYIICIEITEKNHINQTPPISHFNQDITGRHFVVLTINNNNV